MIGTYHSYRGPIQQEFMYSRLVKLGIGMLWIISLFEIVDAQTKFQPVRINCGGPRYVDPGTNFLWINDSNTYVTSGTKSSKCNDSFLTISNTTKSMRAIYCSNRSFKPSAQPNLYTIPVLNTTASYIVRLHFAELVCHNQFFYFYCACAEQQNDSIYFFTSEISAAECTQNGCTD